MSEDGGDEQAQTLQESAAEAQVGLAKMLRELQAVKSSMDVALDVLRDHHVRLYGHMRPCCIQRTRACIQLTAT